MGTSLQQNAEWQEKDRYDRESFQSMKAHHEQFNPPPRVDEQLPGADLMIEGEIVRNLRGYHILALLDRLASSAAKLAKPTGTLAQNQRYFPQMVTPVCNRLDKIERD